MQKPKPPTSLADDKARAQLSVAAYRAKDFRRLHELAEAAMALAKEMGETTKTLLKDAKSSAELDVALAYGASADRAMREMVKCIALRHRLDTQAESARRKAAPPPVSREAKWAARMVLGEALATGATFH